MVIKRRVLTEEQPVIRNRVTRPHRDYVGTEKQEQDKALEGDVLHADEDNDDAEYVVADERSGDYVARDGDNKENTQGTTHPPKRIKTGGRQKGTKNRTTERRENLLALRHEVDDMLPHEFLLKVCRGHEIEVTAPGAKNRVFVVPTLQQRIDAANKAAPYFAPRLSTVEVIQGLNDADLEAIIQGAAAQAGVEIRFDEQGQPIISTIAQASVHNVG